MKNGDRIELLQMVNDPRPIESGSMGVIMNIGGGVVNVRWDNKRDLGVIVGVDKFKVYKQVLFFDYFVDEETTSENVSINVIECKGEIYPDTIDPKLSSFVDELFLNGTIELGKVRDMGEEGDEYHVMIYEGDTEFLISYDVMVDEDNSHSPEYWDMSKEVKIPKGTYSFM